MKGKIVIDKEFCKGCQFCIAFCPKKAVQISAKRNTKGYAYAEYDKTKKCSGCATCALVCPEATIEVYRE